VTQQMNGFFGGIGKAAGRILKIALVSGGGYAGYKFGLSENRPRRWWFAAGGAGAATLLAWRLFKDVSDTGDTDNELTDFGQDHAVLGAPVRLGQIIGDWLSGQPVGGGWHNTTVDRASITAANTPEKVTDRTTREAYTRLQQAGVGGLGGRAANMISIGRAGKFDPSTRSVVLIPRHQAIQCLRAARAKLGFGGNAMPTPPSWCTNWLAGINLSSHPLKIESDTGE